MCSQYIYVMYYEYCFGFSAVPLSFFNTIMFSSGKSVDNNALSRPKSATISQRVSFSKQTSQPRQINNYSTPNGLVSNMGALSSF